MSSGNATHGILRLPSSTLVRPLAGHTRSSLGIYRDSPCRSLVPGARPTRRRPIASSVCPPSKLTRRRLGALSHQRHGRPLPRSSSSGHTSSPSCCSRPRPRPSNTAAVTAMPLLLLVLLLTRAFLRGARQEGPLVPPTLPWQVELSEGPPPAPPLLRRRPHNKTHFPLHRLS